MHYQRYQFGPGRITDGIKLLIIINAAVFFIGQITGLSYTLDALLGIVPYDAWSRLHIWQPFTYLFLHGSLMHVGMNMLVLWMFGSELEMLWGRNYFMKFYFITGMGAGLLTIIFQPYSTIPVIGASGAIYGVLLAYGMLFPDREVLIYFLFPIKVKYMVAIIGAIAFMSSLSPQGDNIAHFTHLSGMLIGYLLLKKGRPGLRSRRDQHIESITESIRKIRDKLSKYYEAHPSERPHHSFMDETKKPSSMKEDLDTILDKINRVGYGGLNEEEKKRLFDASNHLSNRSPKH